MEEKKKDPLDALPKGTFDLEVGFLLFLAFSRGFIFEGV